MPKSLKKRSAETNLAQGEDFEAGSSDERDWPLCQEDMAVNKLIVTLNQAFTNNIHAMKPHLQHKVQELQLQLDVVQIVIYITKHTFDVTKGRQLKCHHTEALRRQL